MSNADELKAEAMSHFEQGRRREALAAFEAAAQAYQQADQPLDQAEMLNNAGVLQRLQGQHDDALTTLETAVAIFETAGDKARQAQALGNLGDLYAARKERLEAARSYSDAAELFAQVGDRERQSQVLRALSLHSTRQRRWLEALLYMEQSLTARPRLGPGQYLFRLLIRFMLALMGRG
jgi:tetratricopeptide (TPR) repeat protein